MRNAILGSIAGVVLAGLAFLLFGAAPADFREESLAAANSHAMTPAFVIERPPTATAVDVGTAADVSRVSTEEAFLTLEELERRAIEARSAYDIASREFRRAQNVAKWASEPPPTQSIVLPPEFDYLSDDPISNHENIQREAIDSIWAPATETHIHGYLAARPEVTDRYGYPMVQCRTSRCEIAFVAYGVGAAREFRDLISDFFDQGWTDQFKSGGLPGLINANVRNHGDVTTILWHLTQFPEQLRRTIVHTDSASR